MGVEMSQWLREPWLLFQRTPRGFQYPHGNPQHSLLHGCSGCVLPSKVQVRLRPLLQTELPSAELARLVPTMSSVPCEPSAKLFSLILEHTISGFPFLNVAIKQKSLLSFAGTDLVDFDFGRPRSLVSFDISLVPSHLRKHNAVHGVFDNTVKPNGPVLSRYSD